MSFVVFFLSNSSQNVKNQPFRAQKRRHTLQYFPRTEIYFFLICETWMAKKKKIGFIGRKGNVDRWHRIIFLMIWVLKVYPPVGKFITSCHLEMNVVDLYFVIKVFERNSCGVAIDFKWQTIYLWTPQHQNTLTFFTKFCSWFEFDFFPVVKKLHRRKLASLDLKVNWRFLNLGTNLKGLPWIFSSISTFKFSVARSQY